MKVQMYACTNVQMHVQMNAKKSFPNNNSPPRTPEELFLKYNILPFNKLYTPVYPTNATTYMYKVHHNMLPNMFKEYYHKSYNTGTLHWLKKLLK